MPKKPSNATWVASASIDATKADSPLSVPSHRFSDIEIRWYENPDRVKVEFRGAGPAVVSKAFLSGEGLNVIFEITEA